MPAKVYKVRGPNPKREKPVPYYEHAGEVCERVFGRRPSRTTLFKYLQRGFPVKRHGPYVQMPVMWELKRPMTTREAMARFISRVQTLEARYGVPSALALAG